MPQTEEKFYMISSVLLRIGAVGGNSESTEERKQERGSIFQWKLYFELKNVQSTRLQRECKYFAPPLSQSVFLYVFPFIRLLLSIILNIGMSDFISVSLSICLYIFSCSLTVYLSNCSSVYCASVQLSVFLSACLSACLSLSFKHTWEYKLS